MYALLDHQFREKIRGVICCASTATAPLKRMGKTLTIALILSENATKPVVATEPLQRHERSLHQILKPSSQKH